MKSEDDNTMIRTQIQLTESQHERLKFLAERRGVSMARLVREGVDAVLSWGAVADPWDDLFSVVGKYGGDSPEERVGREHDEHLEEIYGEWRRSS
jgi:hypothetical protein